MKLVFATNNEHKLREIRDIAKSNIQVMSLADLGFSGEIPEDFETLEENAAQKAYHIYHRYKIPCFADDTGLEIEALNNEPGVYSARYAGINCSFQDNVTKVLKNLHGIENRNARFRTVIALVEEGALKTFNGEIKGLITYVPKGSQGFGYDPVFQPEGHAITFAEMQADEKNRISHRTRALVKLIEYLNTKEIERA